MSYVSSFLWVLIGLFLILQVLIFILARVYFKKKIKTQNKKQKEKLFSVFHDFKTPITSILGYSQLLENPERSEDVRLEFLKIIQSEAEKVLLMISETLSDVSEGVENKSVADCSKVINFICKNLVFSANKKDIKIKLDIGSDLHAKMSEIAFYRVVSNVLENSVKHNKHGGAIDVKLFQNGDFISVVVKDSGTGISPENINNVFERGFRENSDVCGFGLGLSNVKEIVTSHGGKIMLESKIGKGSKFTICIPRDESADK
ncbi:MAG: HAMP domain-containing histidine kinase [Oscillospiraceae bacterium]|jgi:two-component system phosphate regulon sensor histidine kinase PhoR|nr:HAMP domain-containing histidine kinase [Oscillospiraceae bacterium]